MQKIIALWLIMGIVVGAVAGYRGGYLAFQQTIAELQSEVDISNSNLRTTQAELSAVKEELSKTQEELYVLKVKREAPPMKEEVSVTIGEITAGLPSLGR